MSVSHGAIHEGGESINKHHLHPVQTCAAWDLMIADQYIRVSAKTRVKPIGG